MSQYSAFLRPYHGKSTNLTGNPSSSSNENDENSTIKNLILKHTSKVQQSSLNKGTMRGILGEVGNMTLSNKPLITKPRIIQQQNSIATIIESQSIISIPQPAPPPLPTIVVNQIDDIIFDDDIIDVPAEFDCDSIDLFNITTVSEYVIDICKYWRELEQNTPIQQNFLLNRCEGR
jgi:hypothetical protein